METKMTETPIPPSAATLPKPLTAEELGPRLKALGEALKGTGCSDLSQLIASRVVDARVGGRMQNISTAIPALAAQGEKTSGYFVAAADRNNDKAVDTVEGMAMLMAGVERAVKANVSDIASYLKDLKPDAGFFTDVDAMCHKIQATSCSVPKGNPLDQFKPKGREK
jgi:hypothetical protein